MKKFWGRPMKIAINKCWGGFSISNKCARLNDIEWHINDYDRMESIQEDHNSGDE